MLDTDILDRRYEGIRIGAAWISMIEPEPGHEGEFNRWYSDDHFYAGGMCLAGIFAGRRWVATKELRELRYSTDEDLARYGCYLHTNLFDDDQLGGVNVALSTTLERLGREGRMYATEIPRRHIYTAITPYEGVVYRDSSAEGPRDIHALDYPFAGVVVEIIDAHHQHHRAALLQWLRTKFIPKDISTSSALMCLVFRHEDLPEIIKSPRLPAQHPCGKSRVVLLWFLECDPRTVWNTEFADHPATVQQSGMGDLVFAGPFIPTIPGSNRYIDELR